MSLKEIINGSVDIYSFLDVAPSANIGDIRRLYRRMALEYHPDKDPSPEAAKKFHILSQAFEILSDHKLRNEYDRLREVRKVREKASEEIEEDVKRFKENLERSERENFHKRKAQTAAVEQDLEILREEGYRMRRNIEKEKEQETATINLGSNTSNYISYRDIDCGALVPLEVEKKVTSKDERGLGVDKESSKCTIKWKFKAELESKVTEEILAEIMSIFGPVKKVTKSVNIGDNYSSGTVEFEDPKDAIKASEHNYRISAKKWDHTRVRKLASLLRGCKIERTAEEGNIRNIQKKLSADNRPNQHVIEDIMNGSEVIDVALREVLMADE